MLYNTSLNRTCFELRFFQFCQERKNCRFFKKGKSCGDSFRNYLGIRIQMVSNAKVDLELKKAFQDLQTKKMDAQQRLRTADIQAEIQKQLIRRCELTKEELLSMPPEVPTYQSVGRMFVKQPMDATLKQLDEKMVSAEDKIKNLESSKVYLEKSLKEAEDNIREMVLVKKSSS